MWEAELRLALRHDGARTVLAQRAHRGPLVVQRPFYPEGDICHLYLVHPPGGIVSGDHLTLDLSARDGAHALVTTPAATKFYRAREGAAAHLVQRLDVAGATLEWLPQETLVFDGAQARCATHVVLGDDARFIGWEVLCLGRPASAEPFASGAVHQDFQLWRGNEPLLLDRLRLAPDAALGESWGFAGHAALGTLMAWPAAVADLDALKETAAADLLACTLVDGVLLVRTLAAQGEEVRTRLHGAWRLLRPRLLGRDVSAPRIWAT